MALFAVVLLAAQAAAGEAALREPADDTARRECVAVLASSPEQKQPFSATRVLDVELQTLLSRRPEGAHTLELKLFTPRGHLYQVLTVPYVGSAGEAASTGERRVAGYPRPLREQQAKPVRFQGSRRFGVSASLPVAGTTIMVNSLYGQWRAEPYLDGAPSPCGPAATFEITQ